jgi:polyphenol oxidase
MRTRVDFVTRREFDALKKPSPGRVTAPTAAGPGPATDVREVPVTLPGGTQLWAQSGWQQDLPWVVHGTTGRTDDMSLFGRSAAGEVMQRWLRLRAELACRTVVHARQVHAADVIHHERLPAGVLVAGDGDGHCTAQAGVLLTVSVADCVPIFLVAPDVRCIALLHGGWRGVAAGILERGVEQLAMRFGAEPAGMRVHFGPAICGDCFEVGPEVPRSLGVPGNGEEKQRLDLRAVLAERARRCGVADAHTSTSAHCTRCGDPAFFSHRGGCHERQLAVLAIRPDHA